MKKTIYYTVFRLWGEIRDDNKIWISDGKIEGTVGDEEIVAIGHIKSKEDKPNTLENDVIS